MRKLATIIGALALCACSALPSGLTTSPAPLNNTVIDDVGLKTAWQTFDAALDAINLAMDACSHLSTPRCEVFKPGTAKARNLADGIIKVKVALQAAEHAAAALSVTDYKAAMAEANNALADIKLLIKGS